MNITRAKPVQFSPVVCVPGHEPFNRRCLQEHVIQDIRVSSIKEPEIWKIYRRLSKPQGPAKAKKSNHQCSFEPPTHTIPSTDGMKCMCYENLMRLVKEQNPIPPPQLFRCSYRKAPQNNPNVFPTWAKRALMGFRCNQELQLPLSTLTARWQLKRTIPAYDDFSLRLLFSRYGVLREIRKLSPNSCLVIFDSIEDACRVMQARNIGDPANKLQCSWWHHSMANKTVCARSKGIKVQTDYYKNNYY